MIKNEIVLKIGNCKICFEKLFLEIIILDFLMFPYVRVLHCTLGMLLVVAWSIFNFQKIHISTWFFLLCVIVSNIYGATFFNIGFSGVVKALLVVYVFFLFDYLSSIDLTKYLTSINKILYLYFTFVLLLAVIYRVLPQQYFQLRSFWSLSGNLIEYTEHEISRFTAIASDPNNAGILCISIFSYFLVFVDLSFFLLLLLCIGVTFVVMMTFSITASILMSFALLVFLLWRKGTIEQKKRRRVLWFFVVLFCFITVSLILSSNGLLTNLYVKTLSIRLGHYSRGTLGGRLTIWKKLLSNDFTPSYLLCGKGIVLDISGNEYLPHNGALYLLFSYGLPAAICFFIKFFYVGKKSLIFYISEVVIFVGIFINTGFYDFRFLTGVTLILVLSKKVGEQESIKTGVVKNDVNNVCSITKNLNLS